MYGMDNIECAILDWRHYLSINLDQNPDNILRGSNVTVMAELLRKQTPVSTSNALLPLLMKLNVQDDHVHSSRLLFRYLQGGRENSEIKCHECNGYGHVVSKCTQFFGFCF
jgi:hypothetical protein